MSRLAALEAVLASHLRCGPAAAVAEADGLIDTWALFERLPPTPLRAEVETTRDALTTAERRLADLGGSPEVDLAIRVLRAARAATPLPPLRTGRPRTREARFLWPHLASMWCRHTGAACVPRGRKGPFATFVNEVQEALGLPAPDADALYRATPRINAALPFQLQMARDLAALTRHYER